MKNFRKKIPAIIIIAVILTLQLVIIGKDISDVMFWRAIYASLHIFGGITVVGLLLWALHKISK